MMRRGILAILVWGLVAGFSGFGYAQEDSAAGAMKGFVAAMIAKDQEAVLSYFSKTRPWVYAPYEIQTGRALGAREVTYEETARDFAQHQYWYGFFFDQPNGYTYQVNFRPGVQWRQMGPSFFVAPDSESGNTYIKWEREGGRWVIAEIGETVV